jgi:hypothetical protein
MEETMRKMYCAALALCALAACGEAPQSARDEYAQHEGLPVRDGEFNFNAHRFVRLFNDAARSCGVPYRIADAEPQRGALYDSFRQSFPGDVSMRADLAKDSGRVTRITVLASGEHGAPDRDTLFEIAEVIVLATDAGMTRKKAGAVVADMLEEARSMPDAERLPQRYFEQARYVLRNDDDIDYWWTATPN